MDDCSLYLYRSLILHTCPSKKVPFVFKNKTFISLLKTEDLFLNIVCYFVLSNVNRLSLQKQHFNYLSSANTVSVFWGEPSDYKPLLLKVGCHTCIQLWNSLWKHVPFFYKYRVTLSSGPWMTTISTWIGKKCSYPDNKLCDISHPIMQSFIDQSLTEVCHIVYVTPLKAECNGLIGYLSGVQLKTIVDGFTVYTSRVSFSTRKIKPSLCCKHTINEQQFYVHPC